MLQDSFGIDPFYYVNWEDPIYDQNEDFSVEENEDSFSEYDSKNADSEDDSKNAASGNNLKAARQPAPLLESSAADASATTTAGTSSSKSGRVGAANAGGGANTSASTTGGAGGGRGHAKSEPALKCDVKRCELPACRCGGTTVPGGGAQRNSTPQLVMLTFDDAVNDLSKRLVMAFIKLY
jgi:hypothetical protein